MAIGLRSGEEGILRVKLSEQNVFQRSIWMESGVYSVVHFLPKIFMFHQK